MKDTKNDYMKEEGKGSLDYLKELLTAEELQGFYKGMIFKLLMGYEDRGHNGLSDLYKAQIYLKLLTEMWE